MAAPMFGIFTDKPNVQSFTPARISERIAGADRDRYRQLGP